MSPRAALLLIQQTKKRGRLDGLTRREKKAPPVHLGGLDECP